jgi:hypothetical protein
MELIILTEILSQEPMVGVGQDHADLIVRLISVVLVEVDPQYF